MNKPASRAKPPPWRAWAAVTALAAALLCTASSCNDDSDFGHQPPTGQGSILIDNNTSDNLSVFINGQSAPDVGEDRYRAYDLDPGIYRVVLEQQGGDQNFRGDVDVIEGRVTVLDVAFGPGTSFDVLVFFQ